MKTSVILILSIALLFCGCAQKDYNKAEVDNLLDCEKQITQTDKDICYGNAAIIKKDLTLCAKISIEGLRDNCYYKGATKKVDESVCGRIIDNNVKDKCYYDVAMNKNISSICESIANKVLQGSCNQEITVRNGNLSLCDSENGSTAKDYCYEKIGIEQRDVTICNKMEDNSQECYAAIAEILTDPQICERIEVWANRENCILKIAEITKNDKICATLTGPDQWALCAAYTKKDFHKCQLIFDNKLGSTCYTGVAVISLNETICNKNSDIYLIDCIQKVAEAKNDTTICDNIIGEENKVAKNQCKINAGQSYYAQNDWKT